MKLNNTWNVGYPYPTRLVERGVRSLKETLPTNMKAGDKFSKKVTLDIALDVMKHDGAGGASEKIPMKRKKGAKEEGKYPFLF